MTEVTETPNLNNMTIIGLKTEVKRQVGLHKHTKGVLATTNNSLVRTWRVMYQAGLKKETINMIWEHLDSVPCRVQIQSELIGIRSKIEDYTNKNGVVSKAHFTVNGNYLGSVKAMGDQPKSYLGWFLVESDVFEIDFKKLVSAEYGISMSQLFIPYTLVPENERQPVWVPDYGDSFVEEEKPVEEEEDDDDDVPIAQLIAKRQTIETCEIETCEKCYLIECCCEADRLQVIKDDEQAIADGYVEIDGRWRKPIVEEPKPKRKYVKKDPNAPKRKYVRKQK